MSYIKFFQTAMQLKHIKRTGWVRERINEPESVADHSFMTAFLTQILYDKEDVADVVQIGLFHDIAETHIGDIVWERGAEVDTNLSDAKHKQELDAIITILGEVVEPKMLSDIKTFIGQDYSPKAKFVREIEKLEMAVQALIYELESGKHEKFDEFWKSAKTHISSPPIKKLFNEFYAYRLHEHKLSKQADLILTIEQIKKTFIPFIKPVYSLKQAKRQGWIEKNVPKPESIAEHCFGVAVLASTLTVPNIDKKKIVLMSIIHDLGEAIIGDQIWERGTVGNKKLKSVKDKEERDGVEYLLKLVGKSEYLPLFEDFAEQKSPESKLLKELDKLEMVFQALDYEKQMKQSEPFDEFWENAEKYIKTPEVKVIFDELKKQRT